MGRLGWPAEQALDTPLVYIAAALQARTRAEADSLLALQKVIAPLLGVEIREPETPEQQADNVTRGLKALVKLAERNRKQQEARSAARATGTEQQSAPRPSGARV
jgi:hypothetical protein